MSRRKLLSLYSLILFLCLGQGSWGVRARDFSDRTGEILQRGIMTNYPDGEFHPERVLTRAQLATILVNTFGLDQRINQPNHSSSLSDVSSDYWAIKDIQLVVNNEIMTVDDRGRFLPDQPVTRAAGLAAFAQAYGVFYISEAEISRILAPYADSDRIPDWARRAIATAIFEGLVNIDRANNRLNPDELMTRGDMVYTLSQYLAKQENPGTIPTIPLD